MGFACSLPLRRSLGPSASSRGRWSCQTGRRLAMAPESALVAVHPGQRHNLPPRVLVARRLRRLRPLHRIHPVTQQPANQPTRLISRRDQSLSGGGIVWCLGAHRRPSIASGRHGLFPTKPRLYATRQRQRLLSRRRIRGVPVDPPARRWRPRERPQRAPLVALTAQAPRAKPGNSSGPGLPDAPVELVVVDSPYRYDTRPLLDYIGWRSPRDVVAVFTPSTSGTGNTCCTTRAHSYTRPDCIPGCATRPHETARIW